MKHIRSLSLVFLTALCLPAWSADAPASGPDLPEAEISKIYKDAKSQPGDKTQRLAKNAELLAASRKCLAEHPEVPVTAPLREVLVRRVMLPAAERMFNDDVSPANRDQLKALATEVVKNPLTEGHLLVPEKVRAAYTLAKLNVFPKDDKVPVDAAKHIRALVDSFPPLPNAKDPTAFTGQAIVYAAQLATDAKEKTLADEYCKTIAEKYLAADNAISTLIAAGHAPMFEAEMATLDGKKLAFPADTKGKVVVLDFWATWCGPCVASMPHIKDLHEKYKDKGVMILGVSCDSPLAQETPEQNRKKVEDFLSTKGYVWTQTYAGKWPDAAVKYGISRIPTVFVLGKDGRILSTTARGREAQLIDEALAAP